MALVLKDRVRETTTSSGTGSMTLAGAVAGFQSFEAVGNGNFTYYTIADRTTGAWETGVGYYTTAATTRRLARVQVLESSNAGALVSFASNSKDVFVSLSAAGAQDRPSWVLSIGGVNNDVCTGVCVDASGNVFAVGYTDTQGQYVGTYDAWVARFSSSGVLQWQKTFGTVGTSQDLGAEIVADKTGNIYVFGYSNGFPSQGSNDGFVLKLNSVGAVQWQRGLGAAGDGYNLSGDVDPDGNVYAAGWANATPDIILSKYSPSGSLLWQRGIGGGNTEVAYGVAASSSAVYVAGSTSSVGNNDILLVKLGVDGSAIWTRTLNYTPTNSYDNVLGVALAPDGGAYIAAQAYDNAKNDYSILLARYDASGTRQWARLFRNLTGLNKPQGKIATDAYGYVYFAGYNNTPDKSFVAKYSPAGALVWHRWLDLVGTDRANGLTVDAVRGSVYVAGQHNPSSLTAYLAKLPADGSDRGSFGSFAIYGAGNYTDEAATVGEGTTSVGLYTTSFVDYEQQLVDAPSTLAITTHLRASYWFSSMDLPSTQATPRSLKVAPDGSIYVLVGNTLGQATSILIKYNTDGTIQWSRAVLSGGNGAIAIASDGSVYICATYNGMYVVKYSSTGTALWEKLIGNAQSFTGEGIAVDANYVYCCGSSVDSGTGLTYGVWVSLFPSSGNVVLARGLGLNAGVTTRFYGIAVYAGTIYVTGTADTSGTVDVLVAAWQSSGVLSAQRTIGSVAGSDAGYDIVVSNSYVHIAGLAAPNGFNTLMLCLNRSDLLLVAQRQVHTNGTDEFYNLAADSDGNVYAIGVLGQNSTDAVVVGFTPTLTVVMQKSFGSLNSFESARGIAFDAYKNLYIAGALPNDDCFVAKLPDSGAFSGMLGPYQYKDVSLTVTTSGLTEAASTLTAQTPPAVSVSDTSYSTTPPSINQTFYPKD